MNINSLIDAPITEVDTLGWRCILRWELVYQDVQRVTKLVSCYPGGHVDDPSYQAVCAGTTGHAEVIQVTFDPTVVSFRQLLEVFFTIHDPTTLNRQGADRGTQYRSAIYTLSQEQDEIAHKVIRDFEAEGIWKDPIVTEVTALDHFYAAEAYHQNYYRNNPNQGYCQVVVAPKVAKFRKKFLSTLMA